MKHNDDGLSPRDSYILNIHCGMLPVYSPLSSRYPSKIASAIKTAFISALPHETLEKLFADILELIIKDLKVGREQEPFYPSP